MKYLICFMLVVALVSGLSASQLQQSEQNLQGFIENIVNKTLNSITANLTDPIVKDYINLSFNQTDVLEGNASISDVKLFGLKNLLATYIKVDGITNITLVVKVPEILLNFKYDLDVLLLELVPLYGQGVNNILIDNVILNITGEISLAPKIKLQNLSVLINLDNAVFNLNGLLNNPEFTSLVNLFLNDNFVNIVNDNNVLLSKVLGTIIAEIINNAVSSNKAIQDYITSTN